MYDDLNLLEESESKSDSFIHPNVYNDVQTNRSAMMYVCAPYRTVPLEVVYKYAPSKMVSREAGNLIDARLVHPSKAPSPMYSRDESAGNSIGARLVHP